MPQPNGRYILLAEDDIDDQEFLIEALLELDNTLHIHVEESGEQAVAYLEQVATSQFPCLIILDYNLPKVNGHQILSFMKQNARYEGVKKLVWSTSSSAAYEQRCLQEGALAYLVKPTDMHGIRRIAAIMLEHCNQ